MAHACCGERLPLRSIQTALVAKAHRCRNCRLLRSEMREILRTQALPITGHTQAQRDLGISHRPHLPPIASHVDTPTDSLPPQKTRVVEGTGVSRRVHLAYARIYIYMVSRPRSRLPIHRLLFFLHRLLFLVRHLLILLLRLLFLLLRLLFFLRCLLFRVRCLLFRVRCLLFLIRRQRHLNAVPRIRPRQYLGRKLPTARAFARRSIDARHQRLRLLGPDHPTRRTLMPYQEDTKANRGNRQKEGKRYARRLLRTANRQQQQPTNAKENQKNAPPKPRRTTAIRLRRIFTHHQSNAKRHDHPIQRIETNPPRQQFAKMLHIKTRIRNRNTE